MICKQCGNQIQDDSKFCGHCGSKLQPQEDAEQHQNKKANGFIARNPNTVGSIFISGVTFIFQLLYSLGWLVLIPLGFAINRIIKAKKEAEDKKLIVVAWVVIFLSIIIWVLNIVGFVILQLEKATG